MLQCFSVLSPSGHFRLFMPRTFWNVSDRAAKAAFDMPAEAWQLRRRDKIDSRLVNAAE
jgi:hypothetical protein